MPQQAELETIVKRLVEIDRRVQRQLEKLAATLGLTLEAFFGLREQVARNDPILVADVARKLERRLPAGFDRDALRRPAPADQVGPPLLVGRAALIRRERRM